VLTQEGYDSAMQILLNLDFSTSAAAAHSTSKWVSEVSRMAGLRSEEWALECGGTAVVEAGVVGTAEGQATNDLGGLVRKKKRKVDDGDATESTEIQASKEIEPAPAVNVLVGRKKAKS
jgi:hypothetical protein